MKKLILAFLFLVTLTWSQTVVPYSILVNTTFAATGTSLSYSEIGSGTSYHKITWTVSGTVSSCSVRVDYSTDGSSWIAGGVIGAQTCTSNGGSSTINTIVNYVRINMVTFVGTGTVTVTYTGYVNNPSVSGLPTLGTQYQVLQAGAATPGYDAVHLDQSAAVTGTLPETNLPAATVFTDPSTAKVIQPTADVVPLALKQFNGVNTADLFQVLDKSAVVGFKLDKSFNLTIAGSYTSSLVNSGNAVTEGTGANAGCGAGIDCQWADSTQNGWMMKNNNGPSLKLAAGPTSTINIYVCQKALGGNCAYNGDGGQVVNAACPADTCTGLDKTHPIKTPGQVATLVNTYLLTAGAGITVNFADAANTGTDCPIFTGPIDIGTLTAGFGPNVWYRDPFFGFTDAYPANLVTFQGNDTTPANTPLVGAAACGGTVSSAKGLVRVHGINFRIHSMAPQYYGYWGIQTDNANLYYENLTLTSDNKGTGIHVVGGYAHHGGTITATNTAARWCDYGARCDHKTPLDSATTAAVYTISISGALSQAADSFASCALGVGGGAYDNWDKVSVSFAGAGTYNEFCSFERSLLHPTDWYSGATQTFCSNAPNATFLFAERESNLVFGIAGNISLSAACGGPGTTYKQRAKALRGSYIQVAGSASLPAGGTADQTQNGAWIVLAGGASVAVDQIGPTTNGTCDPLLQNASGTLLQCWDTTNNRYGIGATPSDSFSVFNKFIVSSAGLVTKSNNLATAGQGFPVILGATSQKAETGAADANVLTVTPASVVGTYMLRVVVSVSSATSGVIGWTATWTDSNGNAQAPTNLSLFQSGTAAPALTFTVSAAGNYYGTATIDTNAAGTNIVIKWTGGGTTAAKVSAWVERVI